ncbi:DUF5941 domain-containing protein [Nonomuraea antimicrobica]
MPATLVALLAVVAVTVAGLLEPGPILLLPVAIVLLLVLPTTPRNHLGRLDWLTPPLLRAAEFFTVIAVGLAADAPKWLLFVLVYVVGYHTYDTVYRTRQSIWPPAWVFRAGLGWELRLLIIGVGAAFGVVTPVLAVLTAYLFVLFAVESVTSWVRLDKASAQAGADAEQDLEASLKTPSSRPRARRRRAEPRLRPVRLTAAPHLCAAPRVFSEVPAPGPGHRTRALSVSPMGRCPRHARH